MKVAFDFDDTLDQKHVQKFAKELMEQNVDVHVVTNNHVSHYVYETTDELKIPKNNVHFLGYTHKYVYFEKNNDYLFHLDNDIQDVLEISDLTKVQGILYDCDWKENCLLRLKYGK
jgi:hypothetical protein